HPCIIHTVFVLAYSRATRGCPMYPTSTKEKPMSLSRKLIVHILPALMLFVGGASPNTRADAATDWNAIAVQALVAAVPSRPGPVAFLDMAIVQAAVHDAVQAIDRRFEPYHVQIKGASGSPEAAAKAAHDV